LGCLLPRAHMLSELLFSFFLEWITPLEYNGTALVDATMTGCQHDFATIELLRGELADLSFGMRWLLDQVVRPLAAFLEMPNARDKSLRLLQEACVLALGLIKEMRATSSRLSAMTNLLELQRHLSSSRRAFRLFSFFTPMLALCEATPTAQHQPSPEDLLRTGAHLGTLGFSLLDSLRWLQQFQLASGSASTTSRRALRCLALRHACALAIALLHASKHPELAVKLRRAREWAVSTLQQMLRMPAQALLVPEAKNEGGCGARSRFCKQERELLLACTKESCQLVHAMHFGSVARTHDAFAGLLGCFVSTVDILAIWRKAHRQIK